MCFSQGEGEGQAEAAAAPSTRSVVFSLETPPGSQVFPHQRSAPGKAFRLFAFPLLPLHQRMGQCFEFAASLNSPS